MTSSKGFPGFPDGKLDLTPLPGLFFSELLPVIDDAGELKLTLFMLWAVSNAVKTFPVFRRSDLLGDDLLMEALSSPGMTPQEALDDALERCVARGTLLQASTDERRPGDVLFVLNSSRGRATLDAIKDGTWEEGDIEPPRLRVARPTIYTLYEQNIGPLTPMVAEHLRDAENTFPAAWIEEAIDIAVANNVRRWRYIEAILDRWQTEGKDERKDRGDSETARQRYVSGRFADFWDS